jgi:hypothetical protein
MQSSTLGSLIPAARLPIVENALLQTFNTASVSAIEPLAGGLSGSIVCRITIDSQSYILKMDAPSTPARSAA